MPLLTQPGLVYLVGEFGFFNQALLGKNRTLQKVGPNLSVFYQFCSFPRIVIQSLCKKEASALMQSPRRRPRR